MDNDSEDNEEEGDDDKQVELISEEDDTKAGLSVVASEDNDVRRLSTAQVGTFESHAY